MKTFMKSYFQFQLKSALYTGSMAPVDFSGAVFTCMHFQKMVTNDLSAADLVHADFIRPNKMHEPRTGFK